MDQDDLMAQWMGWFASLGEAVVEMGSPFTASIGIESDGSRVDAFANLTGSTVLEADGLDDAAGLVANCPALVAGGSREVCEVIRCSSTDRICRQERRRWPARRGTDVAAGDVNDDRRRQWLALVSRTC